MTEPASARAVRARRAKVALSTASVYPESTATAFEIAAAAGLRRRRGDGLDRPGQPGRHRAAPAVGLPRGARSWRCTRRAWSSPSGSGAPTRGSSSSGRGTPPRSSARETVVVHPPFRWQREYARQFRRRDPADGGRDRRAASRSRTCSRCGPAAGRSRRTPRTGTRRRRTSPTSRSTCRTPRSSRSDALAMAADDGRPALARAHRRRHRHAPATSTSCPAAATSRAPSCSRGWPGAASTGLVVVRGEHPQGRRPGRARGRPRRGAGLHPAQPGRAARAGHAAPSAR